MRGVYLFAVCVTFVLCAIFIGLGLTRSVEAWSVVMEACQTGVVIFGALMFVYGHAIIDMLRKTSNSDTKPSS